MWYLLALTRDYSFLGNYKSQCKEEHSEKEMRVGMHKNVCINFALTQRSSNSLQSLSQC